MLEIRTERRVGVAWGNAPVKVTAARPEREKHWRDLGKLLTGWRQKGLLVQKS